MAHWINLCLKVYSGAYKRHFPAVTEVDNFEGVLPGGIMAVNLVGNYKPPHLARVNQVTETFCNVQWLKGIYKRKWVPMAWLVFDSNSKGKCDLL